MEYNGQTYISARYTKEAFNRLNLSMSSDEREWGIAIGIFEDRIRGRYLNIINSIINQGNLVADGFAVMALNCSLIETLLQFKNGWDETPYGRNSREYKLFLCEKFHHIFVDERLAEIFYINIRCGILHSAQTKNSSQLTVGKDYTVKSNWDGGISVDVIRFFEEIERYFNNYIYRLRNPENGMERENFLRKMKFLCEK